MCKQSLCIMTDREGRCAKSKKQKKKATLIIFQGERRVPCIQEIESEQI